MDVADLVPLLRAVSGARDPGGDDHARHGQRGKDDDVEVGNKVIPGSSHTFLHRLPTGRRHHVYTTGQAVVV